LLLSLLVKEYYKTSCVTAHIFALKTSPELSMVAHTCNPATWKVEIKRLMVQDQPKQKIIETPISTISLTWWHPPVIAAMQEA
jgi:hypothetical protein